MSENVMSMNDLHPLISEAIKNGGQFILHPKGVSMLPTIIPIQDSLVLVEPCDIRKNDIVLYKRDNGVYVAHRIIAVKGDEYIMCGDNQCYTEHGITNKHIIAKVSQIRKPGGKVISEEKIRNCFYAEKLRLKRFKGRCINKAKQLLYPVYSAVFKRNK